MKMCVGGHSVVTPLAAGSCLRLSRTHLAKKYAVTFIYNLFKVYTYKLWEKGHIGCRVIWWGHLHVQLLYSYNQKLACERPQAIPERCGTNRSWRNTPLLVLQLPVSACAKSDSGLSIRFVVWWLHYVIHIADEGMSKLLWRGKTWGKCGELVWHF